MPSTANQEPIRRGLCLVLAGPSGSGKTSITERLLARDTGIVQSVSATTRAPRPGEIEGVHYYFHSQASFDDLVANGGMLEHATVFGRSYGIPPAPVVSALEKGIDVAFVVDWQGHRTLREKLPGDVLGVFIEPPSFEILEERLRNRGDIAEIIAQRMAVAEDEVSHDREFDRVVINYNLDDAVARVQAILTVGRQERQPDDDKLDFADVCSYDMRERQ